MSRTSALAAALMLAAIPALAQQTYELPKTVPAIQTNVTRHGHFYVGGSFVGDEAKRQMIGQMYVEMWAPAKITHKYPLVFFHGFGGTGTTWISA